MGITSHRSSPSRPDRSDWSRLLHELPPDLDELARATGAVPRWRVLRHADVLVRLLLLWVLAGMGLRTVASWAARSRWVTLTEGALRHRFAAAEPFVAALLAHVLNNWVRSSAAAGARLRLVDASSLAGPGANQTRWRVHAVFDPLVGRLTEVELTDEHGGEALDRAKHTRGDLAVGDRGLAHPRALVTVHTRGTWSLVRAHFQSLSLRTAEGARFDAAAALDHVGDGVEEFAVTLRHRGTTLPMRLIVAALPPEQAARAREKLLKQARKKSRTVSAWTLRLAGYVCLLTTLPPEVADRHAVLVWYRLRWQIELFFKRCKSLLNLHVIQSTRPELVRVHLLTALLVAALIDRLNGTLPAPTPEDDAAVRELDGAAGMTTSLWRLTATHRTDLLLVVAGGTPFAARRKADRKARKLLRERPRQRHARHARATARAVRRAMEPLAELRLPELPPAAKPAARTRATKGTKPQQSRPPRAINAGAA